MGRVYLATDTDLERKVAVKILAPQLSADTTFIRRFASEAKAAAKIQHSNVIRIYEVGNDASEGWYYAMEYYDESEELEERGSRRILPWREVLDIGVQLTAALEAAHAVGIVHRDVKPENCLMIPESEYEYGKLKLIDFGIAKDLTTCPRHSGIIAGSALFMAPEQARAEPTDSRTDVYAVGGVLYFLLAGRAPYEPTHADWEAWEPIRNMLREPFVPLSRIRPSIRIPASLDAIITKALAKDPAHRYQTMAQLRCALSAIDGGQSRRRPSRPHVRTEHWVPTKQSPAPAVRLQKPKDSPVTAGTSPELHVIVPGVERELAATPKANASEAGLLAPRSTLAGRLGSLGSRISLVVVSAVLGAYIALSLAPQASNAAAAAAAPTVSAVSVEHEGGEHADLAGPAAARQPSAEEHGAATVQSPVTAPSMPALEPSSPRGSKARRATAPGRAKRSARRVAEAQEAAPLQDESPKEAQPVADTPVPEVPEASASECVKSAKLTIGVAIGQPPADAIFLDGERLPMSQQPVQREVCVGKHKVEFRWADGSVDEQVLNAKDNSINKAVGRAPQKDTAQDIADAEWNAL